MTSAYTSVHMLREPLPTGPSESEMEILQRLIAGYIRTLERKNLFFLSDTLLERLRSCAQHVNHILLYQMTLSLSPVPRHSELTLLRVALRRTSGPLACFMITRSCPKGNREPSTWRSSQAARKTMRMRAPWPFNLHINCALNRSVIFLTQIYQAYLTQWIQCRGR